MTTAQDLRVVPRGTPGSVSLLAYANHNAGLRAGARAVTVLLSWGIAERALSRPLGQDGTTTDALIEFGDWWKQSERTTWRDLDAFRRAFPGEDTPHRLAVELAHRVEARKGFTGLANVPVVA